MPEIISHYIISPISRSNNEKPVFQPIPKFVLLTQSSHLNTLHILQLHLDAFLR